MLGTYRIASEGAYGLVVIGKAEHLIEGSESVLSLNFVLHSLNFYFRCIGFYSDFFSSLCSDVFFSNGFTVTAFCPCMFSDFFQAFPPCSSDLVLIMFIPFIAFSVFS